MIAWTPSAWTHLPSAGRVAVGPFKRSGRGWDAPYRCTGGACHPEWRSLRGGKMLLAVLGEFARLVRDGVRWDDAHAEFLKIDERSEEHTSELQSLMRISYAVFCLKKKRNTRTYTKHTTTMQK